MRRIFALLMLLVLASTPILDGGCFTSRVITGGRAEYWSDLHAPCAAYVGADRSLTLVLPDRDDLAKAKFFAVKFTPEEVMRAARTVQGQPRAARLPTGLFVAKSAEEEVADPDATDGAWRAPDPHTRWFLHRDQYLPQKSVDSPLVFSPSRDAARISRLPGGNESQWVSVLPPGGYWLQAEKPERQAPFWSGDSSRFTPRPMFGFIVEPHYQWDRWSLCLAQSGRDFMYCQVHRDGGTYMAPTSKMFLIPVALVLDVATSPIQLVFVIGNAIP